MIAFRVCAAMMIGLVALPGCNNRAAKVSVSGTVTFDGQPIEKGQITFEPLAEGVMQFGAITDGKYRISPEFGLVPGSYLVRITASRSTGRSAPPSSFVPDDASTEIREEFIPARYNSVSELEVEIPPETHYEQDFSLSTTQN